MTQGATLTRPKVLYYLRCTVCQITFVSYNRNAYCPLCLAEAKVYGVKEVDTDDRPDS